MKRHHLESRASRCRMDSPSRRAGVTLSEVLMSLLIMGIGVVSLATLFPISTLRTLEATNLTRATVLRYNAEGIIRSFPQMVHNPDGNPNTNEGGRSYIVDPLGWFVQHDTQGQPAPGVVQAVRDRFTHNRPTSVTLPLAVDANNNLLADRFLGDFANQPLLFRNADTARSICSLPDTFTRQAEGFAVPGSATPTSVTFPSEVDLTTVHDMVQAAITGGAVATDPVPGLRITVSDFTGHFSDVRTIVADPTNTSGSTIVFIPALSNRVLNPDVGFLRIESEAAGYTWMLTVRKRFDGTANVDIVTFYKRDFSKVAEQVYVGGFRMFTLGADGAPGVQGVDDDGINGTDDPGEIGYLTSDDLPNNRVIVDWTPSLYATKPERPPIKRGGYLLDKHNMLWYRIRGVEPFIDPATGNVVKTAAVVVLEDNIRRNSTEDLDLDGSLDMTNGQGTGEDRLNPNGALDQGGVIIPRGVISVFPIETQ